MHRGGSTASRRRPSPNVSPRTSLLISDSTANTRPLEAQDRVNSSTSSSSSSRVRPLRVQMITPQDNTIHGSVAATSPTTCDDESSEEYKKDALLLGNAAKKNSSSSSCIIKNDGDEFEEWEHSESARTETTHCMMTESSCDSCSSPSHDNPLVCSSMDNDSSRNKNIDNDHDNDDMHSGASPRSSRGGGGEDGGDNNNNNNNSGSSHIIVQVERKELRSKSCKRQFQAFRELCGKIVNNDRVQLFIVVLIVLNAIMMGIGTFDFVTENSKINLAWEKTDQAFLIVFTIELAMQLVYHGKRLFTDGWLVFDFLIVVFSWSLESLQIVRAFRAFRAFRLATRVTVLKNLIVALMEVAPSMSAIIALLLLILYIYAVMCTVLFSDLHEHGVTDADYFGRLDTSLFTLFQMMTLEWAEIVRQVMKEFFWAWAVFGSFLVLTSFILYSLIIAVVCDAVSVTEHHDEAAMALEEKEETRVKVRKLQQKINQMAVQQAAVMGAVQMALQELGVSEDDDSSTLEVSGELPSLGSGSLESPLSQQFHSPASREEAGMFNQEEDSTR